ncbi:MAG: NADP-dependent oxidoreductase [Maricaulaceae bacterium]
MPDLPARAVAFVDYPKGLPSLETFSLVDAPARAPQPGEVQVRNLWMSVDPYMRGRMVNRKSYVPPFQPGQILEGGAIGEVIESAADGFKPGDLVEHFFGWREAVTAKADGFRVLNTHGLAPQTFLGVAGMPGLTAYVGLTRIAKLQAGERLFVSASAGAVGSLVCQIGKIVGAHVTASAGSPEKCDWLKEIGADAVVNYKNAPDWTVLAGALKEAQPEGFDVYFENVGGDHLAAALERMRPKGRIAVCGMISQYNAERPEPGPPNLANIIIKSLRVEGFVVSDYFDKAGDFAKALGGWVAEGKVQWRETVREGLEAAPQAFLDLFAGENLGKMLVKLD